MVLAGFTLFMDNGVIAHIEFQTNDNNALLCYKLEILVPNQIPINAIGFDSIIVEIKNEIGSDFLYTDDYEIIIEHYEQHMNIVDDDLLEEFKDFVAKSSPILVNNFASNDNINRKGPLSAADYGSLRQIAI